MDELRLPASCVVYSSFMALEERVNSPNVKFFLVSYIHYRVKCKMYFLVGGAMIM